MQSQSTGQLSESICASERAKRPSDGTSNQFWLSFVIEPSETCRGRHIRKDHSRAKLLACDVLRTRCASRHQAHPERVPRHEGNLKAARRWWADEHSCTAWGTGS